MCLQGCQVIRPHGLLSWPEPHASPVLPGEGTKVGWDESTEGAQGVVLERETDGRCKMRRGGEVIAGTLVRVLGFTLRYLEVTQAPKSKMAIQK